MSTVQKVNFEPLTDILRLDRKDFPLADPTLANPLNAVALVDGEWMVINSAYQMLRACDITTLGTGGAGGRATLKSFPLWMERGRTDMQGMSMKKGALIWRGEYEFETRIFNATDVVAGGLAITTMLQPLKVATIAIGGRNYCGLVGSQTSDTAPIVGYVTRLPANNGGKLRFISGYRV